MAKVLATVAEFVELVAAYNHFIAQLTKNLLF
jgi:hypothetical protein